MRQDPWPCHTKVHILTVLASGVAASMDENTVETLGRAYQRKLMAQRHSCHTSYGPFTL